MLVGLGRRVDGVVMHLVAMRFRGRMRHLGRRMDRRRAPRRMKMMMMRLMLCLG